MAKAGICGSGGEIIPAPDDGRHTLQTFEVDGHRVMLDRAVAQVFGAETKRVNWAVARNPDKFSPSHSFRLDAEQAARMIPLLALPPQANGSRRRARQRQPRVFTLKGVIRLATILRTPEALRATDLVIDTFAATRNLDVEQAGAPPHDANRVSPAGLRSKLSSALDGLLSTLVSTTEDPDLRSAAKELGGTALAHVIERLRSRGLENSKLEADTSFVLAQAHKVLADARQTDAEVRRIDLDTLGRKIAIVEKLIEISRKLQPVAFVDMLGTFGATPETAPGRRPSRKRKRRIRHES